MSRRNIVFVLIAFAAAALFVRLGFWQLHRLGERRARNALVRQRLVAAAVDVRALPHDTADVRYRRVRVSGTPDYDHELVLALRSHDGSPGVDLVTPFRRAGTDTAVLVNRGWVYAPDGATVDESRWRESDTVFSGYADVLSAKTPTRPMRNDPRLIRDLDIGAVARAIPYPVAPVYVVATGDTATLPAAESNVSQQAETRPRRLQPPPLDEGPHLSYAIQWFSFAAIAVIGAGVVVAKTRTVIPREPEQREGDRGI